MFYSDQFAHSVNYINYAGKQYDLMPDIEESLQGQTVFEIYTWGKDTLFLGGFDQQQYRIVEDFRYFNRVKIDIPQPSYQVPLDTMLPIEVTIRNTTNQRIDFSAYQNKMSIEYCLFWYGKFEFCEPAIARFPLKELAPNEKVNVILNIKTPKEQGAHWRFRFGIKYQGITGRNSDFTKLEIIETN